MYKKDIYNKNKYYRSFRLPQNVCSPTSLRMKIWHKYQDVEIILFRLREPGIV